MTEPIPGSPPGSTPPDWPYCGHGATAEAPVGCRGKQVGGHPACLAHLYTADRAGYLAGLSAGDAVDHRGTPFTRDLLGRLLDALGDPDSHNPRIGDAWFSEAVFTGDAPFDGVDFGGDARFDDVVFSGNADFGGATFAGEADFVDTTFGRDARFGSAGFGGDARFCATFAGEARFDGAAFSSDAWFSTATFTRSAWFGGAVFTGEACFSGATFVRDARFGGTVFTGHADFDDALFSGGVRLGGAVFGGDARAERARFATARQLGPLVCGGTVSLDGAEFGAPVTVEIAARQVSFRRTRWESTAALRLRRAEVELAGAVLEHRVTLVTYPEPFTDPLGIVLSEKALTDRDTTVRVRSLGGVDAAHLTLTDANLAGCGFAGVVHRDRLRLEDTAAGPPPTADSAQS
ncbi:pentapeptide repeat-containing protein [Streptomyces lycii]|uniref:Pentapeptide repeat-containing protein n=1 Tax=Streptomyces lycii TaxID=2654337 RepID=A0ABQ7FAD4_9ACTN|nr:pentapeptide repeat-containing protein [Streptomyces lycii]KAF4405866.1 pentapeptide repeat-containing protein [Streptomyces lycii]